MFKMLNYVPSNCVAFICSGITQIIILKRSN